MLTNERAEVLTSYLTADIERAKKLFELTPEEALQIINKDGHDFSIEELNAYCDAFKAAVAQGELSEEQLSEVAGGEPVTLTVGGILFLVGCFGGGVGIGIACGAKW